MVIAQQGPLRPSAIELPRSPQVQASESRLLARAIAVPRRIGWHLKAYLPILGIMALVLGSLVFLQLHWLTKGLAGVGKAD